MAINYPKGGANSVKDKDTLRYINQVADGLRSSTTTTIDSISASIVPSVSSTFTYDSRASDSVVDAKGEFSLKNVSGTEVTDGSNWSSITRIELFDTSEDDRDTEATARTIIANGTHIRLFSDDSNWAYYLITAVITSGNTIVLTVALVGSLGKTASPIGSDKNIFIGFDIAVGQQGDNAINVNAVLNPSSISETADGWPTEPVSLRGIFGSGADIQAILLDTISVAIDGSLTPTTGDQTNVALTLGTSSFQYDVTYSDLNRTATVRIETTAGALITEDVVTLAFARHGDKGTPGLDGTNGNFPVFQYRNDTVIPAIPTGGSYSANTGTLTPSTGWTLASSTPGPGEVTYVVQSTFTEDASVEEIAEIGFVDIRNTPGTDIAGTKELMTISGANGLTGKVTTTPAVKEVTEILVGGNQTGTAGGDPAFAEKTDITFANMGAADTSNIEYVITLAGNWQSNNSNLANVYLTINGTVVHVHNSNLNDIAKYHATLIAARINSLSSGGGTLSGYSATSDDTSVTILQNGAVNGITNITGSASRYGGTLSYTGPTAVGSTGTDFSIALDSSHGGPITGTFTASANASTMASEANTAALAAIAAGTVTGLTSSASSNVLNLDATGAGPKTNIAVTLTNPGTATATPTREQEGADSTFTFATTGKLQASSNHNPNSSVEFTFANAESRVNAADRIRNFASNLDGYDTPTAVVAATATGVEALVLGITSGDPIHKFSITNTVGGVDVDLVASLPMAGTGSDLVIKAVETTQGADAFDTGTRTVWTAIADGVSYSQPYSSEANASLQFSEPNTYLLSQGVDSSIAGSVMTVKSATTGNKTPNFSFNITTNGTDQTATAPTVSTTDGTDAKDTQDIITFSLNGAPVSTLEFTSGLTTFEAADEIGNIFNSHVIFTHDDTFAIGDHSLTSGNARIKFVYRNGGFIPTNLASNITIVTGDTGGTLSLGSNPTTTTQGVATGGLSNWSVPRRITGTDGLQGFNTATVSVYQRKATEPTDKPNVVGEYTISTAKILFEDGTDTDTYTEVTSNNWHNAIDLATGIAQLWIRTASVVTRDGTDTIAANEWSGVVQAGSTGVNGDDGLNNATLTYFQRTNSATAPSKPTSEASYNFATQVFLPIANNNWQVFDALTTEGKYLWATTATASSTTGTDVVSFTEWATPIIISEDGADGAGAILIDITTSNGTVLKNNLGSTELTAETYIGGGQQSQVIQDAYTYSWRYGNVPLCVGIGNNQVHNKPDGTPFVATGDPLACPIGYRLSTDKTILVGAEDILSTAQFTCNVGNIPD